MQWLAINVLKFKRFFLLLSFGVFFGLLLIFSHGWQTVWRNDETSGSAELERQVLTPPALVEAASAFMKNGQAVDSQKTLSLVLACGIAADLYLVAKRDQLDYPVAEQLGPSCQAVGSRIERDGQGDNRCQSGVILAQKTTETVEELQDFLRVACVGWVQCRRQ